MSADSVRAGAPSVGATTANVNAVARDATQRNDASFIHSSGFLVCGAAILSIAPATSIVACGDVITAGFSKPTFKGIEDALAY